MTTVVLPVLSCIIALTAFGIGARSLFRKGQPLYFQILICAIGCNALGALANIVTVLWGSNNNIITFIPGLFSHLGCVAFFVTANVGALNMIISEETDRKASLIAFAAPVVYMAILILTVWLILPDQPLSAIITLICLLPGAVSVYHNLRHLLSKEDAMGFLRCIRICDILTLIFLMLSLLSLLLNGLYGNTVFAYAVDCGASLSSLALAVASGKEAEQWKTSISSFS